MSAITRSLRNKYELLSNTIGDSFRLYKRVAEAERKKEKTITRERSRRREYPVKYFNWSIYLLYAGLARNTGFGIGLMLI